MSGFKDQHQERVSKFRIGGLNHFIPFEKFNVFQLYFEVFLQCNSYQYVQA